MGDLSVAAFYLTVEAGDSRNSLPDELASRSATRES
jgi:hypothetical protein